jgi:hypothetical protein
MEESRCRLVLASNEATICLSLYQLGKVIPNPIDFGFSHPQSSKPLIKLFLKMLSTLSYTTDFF